VIVFSKILNPEGWQKCRPSFFHFIGKGLVVIIALVNCSCEKTDASKLKVYDGPIREAENIEMQYSEKEKVTVKIIAKRISEFQNGDRHFPEGVFIEFYDENGNVSSTLSANTAIYYKAEHKWKGQGKVEVKNIAKKEQLNTEELFWFPTSKKINTDKFVTIRNGQEVIYGTGLDAKQDMSEYNILKPEGEFAIED
jgi:LPS export ABC transporter protein LptC